MTSRHLHVLNLGTKTPEQRFCHSSVFVLNFELISQMCFGIPIVDLEQANFSRVRGRAATSERHHIPAINFDQVCQVISGSLMLT